MSQTPDWNEVRKDFPACREWAYLASAATGPISRPVAEAAKAFYEEIHACGELRWRNWSARREEIRAAAAKFINAEPEEIAFTANTSAGVNLVVDLIGGEGGVLSCSLEFPATTVPWQYRGARVELMQPDPDGRLPYERIERELAKPECATLAISYIQYSNGLRLDPVKLGALKGGKRFFLNATQAFGVFPLDVKAAKVDAMATTGHKWLCAAYGCGICMIRKELLEKYPPRQMSWLSVKNAALMKNDNIDLLESNRRTEMGCSSFGSILAFGAALDYVMQLGVENIRDRVLSLNCALTDALADDGYRVLSPLDAESRSAETLISLTEPRRVAEALLEKGVAVSEKPEGIRVATHFFNNEDDIEKLMAGLKIVGARSE